MKKLLFLLIVLFSLPLLGQERELSDYEKYRMEKEKELYQTDEEVFYIVEDMPKFQGEDAKEFRKWIAQNVKYPESAVKNNIDGKVIVSFVVNKNGDVVNAKVEKSIDPALDAEAVRVVEASPQWTPGKQRGEAVSVQFTFPINFILQEEQASEPTVINNYYVRETYPNYRFLLTFGYTYPYYRSSYYGYYDPFYYDWYYPYYSYNYWYGYPYYGYNYWYGHNHYWHNHYYSYNYYNRSYRYGNGRYTRTNTLGWNRDYYRSYSNQTVGRSSTAGITSKRTVSKNAQVVRKPITTTRNTETRTTVNTENGTKRTYSPTYSKPRTATKQSYNRSTPTRQRSTTVYNRSTYNRSNTYTRPSSSSQSRTYKSTPRSTSRSTYQRTTPSRTYSAPSRAPSRSYSAPSRSSSSYSRSSSPSRSSGSMSRSSGASRSSSGRR
jgi:TonB family protein